MADEIWKEIPGTEYSVSDHGRVASRKRKWGGWRVLKLADNGAGYLCVNICANGVTHRAIHQLVAEAFLGPKPTPKHTVNHKNGIKADNRAVNLEWCTQAENNRHKYGVLGHKAAHGERVHGAKVTETEVREIRDRRMKGEPLRVIAADYGIGQATVSRIAHGKNWAWLD